MHRRAELLLLLTAAMWGTNFSVVKVGLIDVPPIFFASSRFVVAVLVMLPLVKLMGQVVAFGRRDTMKIVGLGVLGNSLYMALFVFGAAMTSADNAALILATVPVFVALIGAVTGRERIAWQGWVGVIASLAGIAFVVAGSPREAAAGLHAGGLAGDLLILLATIAWAGYSTMIRPLVERHPPMAVTTLTTAAGAVPLLLLTIPLVSLAELQSVPARGWSALVVSALIGITLPYIFWNYGISLLGSTRTSLYSFLVPLVAVFVAWLWLDERLTPVQWLGAMLALSGVLLARRFVRASHDPRRELEPIGQARA